jgi:SAM-dependent methyltransferase
LPDWFADDDMWTGFAPAIFPESVVSGTSTQVDLVVKLLNLVPGAAVLDMCCGPGRHALELARRGYPVTGVDRNRAYLDQARISADGEDQEVEFVESDIREFRRADTFDAVISMYTSFGYFDSIGDDIRQLENAYASLRSGGQILVQTQGKESASRTYTPRDWVRIGEDIVLRENVIIGPWQRLDQRWTLIRPDGTRQAGNLNIRLYSAVEMAAVLRQAGFGSITVHGDLAGGPYDHRARQMVAVARK